MCPIYKCEIIINYGIENAYLHSRAFIAFFASIQSAFLLKDNLSEALGAVG